MAGMTGTPILAIITQGWPKSRNCIRGAKMKKLRENRLHLKGLKNQIAKN